MDIAAQEAPRIPIEHLTPDDYSVLDRRVLSETNQSLAEWRLISPNDYPEEEEWIPYQVDKITEIEIIPKWMPLPGSQQIFLEAPIFEVLYEGTRGPGKTVTALMDFARDVGKGYSKTWRGVLFRRHFKDLKDLANKAKEWFPPIFPGFWFREKDYSMHWPDGEVLYLAHIEKEKQYDDYHGHEYPWIGWEELVEWENPVLFNMMKSCNRVSKFRRIHCRIRATTNPYGAGHNWIKRRYNLPHGRGKIITNKDGLTRCAIHGRLKENFVLMHKEPFYLAKIMDAAKNKAQAKAWASGDWDVTAGGMVDDIWQNEIHVIPTFDAKLIPHSWHISRAYDHGQSHPFAVGWWLRSSGEPIELSDGRKIGLIRGDLILWAEWYGAEETESGWEGIKLSSKKIAKGIKERELILKILDRVVPGPADSQIYIEDSDRNNRCVADEMKTEGVKWIPANKSPGSRKTGWELLRSKLEAAIPNKENYREDPGVFVCDRCVHWIRVIPPMPRSDKDPDDIPEKYEDHLPDMTRYRITWIAHTVSQSSF